MKCLVFTVPGRPQGKQRPRLGRGGRVYTPAATQRYERSVASSYLVATHGRNLAGYRGPVQIRIACLFADLRRRDLDNVIKAVLDGLNGIAYRDDCQVTHISATRGHGSPECTKVELFYPGLAEA